MRLKSEGRAKRSLEEKQGGSWIEAVQWRDSEPESQEGGSIERQEEFGTESRGACERNVGIVYYSIVETKGKEDRG